MPSIQGIRRNFKKNWALMKRAQRKPNVLMAAALRDSRADSNLLQVRFQATAVED